MQRFTQKELRALVKSGAAVDVTNVRRYEDKPTEPLTQIGYAAGIYGCSGMLFRGCESGTLYAITDRTTAIYIF